jgi:hypothetical protein
MGVKDLSLKSLLAPEFVVEKAVAFVTVVVVVLVGALAFFPWSIVANKDVMVGASLLALAFVLIIAVVVGFFASAALDVVVVVGTFSLFSFACAAVVVVFSPLTFFAESATEAEEVYCFFDAVFEEDDRFFGEFCRRSDGTLSLGILLSAWVEGCVLWVWFRHYIIHISDETHERSSF